MPNKFSWERTCSELERFFALFPDRRDPEDFYSSDVADFIALRQAAGLSRKTILNQLSFVSRFFRWLRESKELCFSDPTAGLRSAVASCSSNLSNTDAPEQQLDLRKLAYLIQSNAAPGEAVSDYPTNSKSADPTTDNEKLYRSLCLRLPLLFALTKRDIENIKFEDLKPNGLQLRTRFVPLDPETLRIVNEVVRVLPPDWGKPRVYPLRHILNEWVPMFAEAGIYPIPRVHDIRQLGVELLVRDLSRIQELVSILGNSRVLKMKILEMLEPASAPKTQRFLKQLQPLLDQLADHSAPDELFHTASELQPATLPMPDDAARPQGQSAAPSST